MNRSFSTSAAMACALLALAACTPTAAPPAELPAAIPVEAAAAVPTPAPAPQMQAVQPELAKALNTEIDQHGAKAVVTALDLDSARFTQVGEAIATADPAWLTLAMRLRQDKDAGSSETLSMAAARALPEAPERVLALVGHGYELDNLCTSPFIGPGPGVAEAYKARAVAALQSVSDPALKAVVDDCIKRVIVAKPATSL